MSATRDQIIYMNLNKLDKKSLTKLCVDMIDELESSEMIQVIEERLDVIWAHSGESIIDFAKSDIEIALDKMPKTKKIMDEAEDDFELIIDNDSEYIGVRNVTTGEDVNVSFSYGAMREVAWINGMSNETVTTQIDNSISYELYHFLDGYKEFKNDTPDNTGESKW
jgi:hypothetical protein